MEAVQGTSKATKISSAKTGAFQEAFESFSRGTQASSLVREYMPVFSEQEQLIRKNIKSTFSRLATAKDATRLDALTKDVFKQSSTLGIKQEVMTDLLSRGKLSQAKKLIENTAKEHSEFKMFTEYTKRAERMFADPKAIEGITKDTTLSLREKSEELLKVQMLAQKMMADGLGHKPIKSMGLFNRAFTGVNEKVGRAYQYYGERAMPYTQGILMKFGLLNDTSSALRTKVTRTSKEITGALRSLPEKEHLAVRDYIQLRTTRNEYVSLGTGKPRMMADRKAMQAVKEKHGITLTEDHLKLANKSDEMLRRLKREEVRRDSGLYETSGIPKSANEMSGYDMDSALKQYQGKGDLVNGYWPAQGTKEYIEGIKKQHPEILGHFEALNNDVYKTGAYIDRARHTDSRLRGVNADINRMSPADEIDKYVNQWLDKEVRRRGTTLLQQAKASALMPLGKMERRSISEEYKFIHDIETHFNKNMNPMVYENMNWFQKGIHKYISAIIPVALASPRMMISNSFQSVFTGGSTQGYFKQLKNTARFQTLYAKEVLLNPKKHKTIMEKIGNGFFDKPILEGIDGDMGRNFTRWWGEQPGLHTMIDEDFKHLTRAIEEKSGKTMMNDVAEGMKHFLTFGFESSDKISRAASFMSATEHGATHARKFIKNVEGGMGLDKAVSTLVKDTHLGTFRQHDIAHVMGALDPKNLKKTANEFIYRYADRAVKQQIFDYSSSGQSYIKAFLKGIDPTVGAMTTFTSWPMYFHELLLGSTRAYKNGDPKPLLSLMAGGVGVYAGASYVMSEDSEYTRRTKAWIEREGGVVGKLLVDQAEGFPAYIKARAPGLSYMAFVEKMISSPAGILTPAVGAFLYPISKGMQEVSGMFGVDEAKDPLRFTTRAGMKALKSDIIYRKLVGLTKGMQGAGIIDWNVQDEANEWIQKGD